MGSVQKMVHCKACDRRTPHIHEKPNQILYFLLTLATFGIWIIHWSGKPRCTECGKEVGPIQMKQ